MDPAEREARVASAIAQLVPQLLEWSTIDGLRALGNDPSRAAGMHEAMMVWLGVPLPELLPATRSPVRDQLAQGLIEIKPRA